MFYNTSQAERVNHSKLLGRYFGVRSPVCGNYQIRFAEGSDGGRIPGAGPKSGGEKEP